MSSPGNALAKAALASVVNKDMGIDAVEKAMEHLLPSVPSTKSAYRVAIVILIEAMDPISMPSMVDLPEAAHWLSQPVDPEVTPLSEILLKAVNSIVGIEAKTDSVVAAHLQARAWTESARVCGISDDDGTLIAVRLPAAVSLPVISYPDFMERMARHQPAFRTLARSAYFALAAGQTPPAPIWANHAKVPPPGALARHRH